MADGPVLNNSPPLAFHVTATPPKLDKLPKTNECLWEEFRAHLMELCNQNDLMVEDLHHGEQQFLLTVRGTQNQVDDLVKGLSRSVLVIYEPCSGETEGEENECTICTTN